MATLADVLREAKYVTPGGRVTGPRTTLAKTQKDYVMGLGPAALQNLVNQRADIDAALVMGDKGVEIGDSLKALAVGAPLVPGVLILSGVLPAAFWRIIRSFFA